VWWKTKLIDVGMMMLARFRHAGRQNLMVSSWR
jgi:hypothetical protein